MDKKIDIQELSLKFMEANYNFTDFHLDFMDLSDDLAQVIGKKKVAEIYLAIIRLSGLVSMAQNKILYEQIQSTAVAENN